MSIYDILAEENKNFSKIMYGVTTATVTNINDPDKKGRIKVKLHNRDSSENETDFIRVMSSMVGKNWGNFFLPEVGDEVLVVFNNGDITKPYVLGSLWNKKMECPVKIADGKNDIRKIKTRSGHEIIFNDKEGDENIEITTPKQLKMIFDDKKEVISIKDKSGKNIVEIDSKNGNIKVKGEKKVTIESGNSIVEVNNTANSVKIESSSTLNLKSQQINIEAGSGMTIKSNGMMNISASGPTNIKGAVVKIN